MLAMGRVFDHVPALVSYSREANLVGHVASVWSSERLGPGPAKTFEIW